MLDILKGLIDQFGQKEVVENQEIPNEHNEGVKEEMLQGLLGGLTNQANSQGGLGSLLGLLGNSNQSSSGLMSNPIVASIAQSVIGNVMSKFGISNNAASGMVGNMLPSVLGSLINKTNDPDDSSVDMGGLMGTLSGGKTSGIDFGSLLSKGTSALADGKLDMSDLMNLVSGNSAPQQSEGGGLGGMLGGLFGNK
ncbi:MAG: DUF937 domain-containing protein [Leadbetterella sp.]